RTRRAVPTQLERRRTGLRPCATIARGASDPAAFYTASGRALALASLSWSGDLPRLLVCSPARASLGTRRCRGKLRSTPNTPALHSHVGVRRQDVRALAENPALHRVADHARGKGIGVH